MNNNQIENYVGYIKENLHKYLPNAVKNAEVIVQEILKNNQKLHGFSIKTHENESALPIVYLEDVLKDYSKNNPSIALEDFMRYFVYRILAVWDHSLPKFMNKILDEHMKEWEKWIYIQFLNPKWNAELLQNCPHHMWNDLAIIYKILVREEAQESIASARVTNQILSWLDVTEQQLYDAALKNSKELFPYQLISMQEILKAYIEKDCQVKDMFILTNRTKINGACVIAYPHVLESVAERMKGSFYAIPSSIHEMIIIPPELNHESELFEFIRYVNQKEVDYEDWLSDGSYYFYDVSTKKLKVISEESKRN